MSNPPDERRGLPPFGDALYWVLKCVVSPGSGEGDHAFSKRLDAIRKRLEEHGDWDDMNSPHELREAASLICEALGIGGSGKNLFMRLAMKYQGVADAVADLPRGEAIWIALEVYFLPLWANTVTRPQSRNNPIGYIFGAEAPCPLQGKTGFDRSVSANLWFIPSFHVEGWRTPTATAISRALSMVGNVKPTRLAKDASGLSPHTEGYGTYESWKRNLSRWTKPWTPEAPPVLPSPDSLSRLAALIARRSASAAPIGSKQANVYSHFLELDGNGRFVYVLDHYDDPNRRDAPRSGDAAHALKHGDAIASLARDHAEDHGRVNAPNLLRGFATARAVQAACFGRDSDTPGLRQLSAQRWGPAEADAQMDRLLEVYRGGVRHRIRTRFGWKICPDVLLSELNAAMAEMRALKAES